MRNFLALILLSFSAFAYETPDAVKEKYKYLYSLPVKQNADGSSSFHNGRLFRRQGVRVVSLKGDRFEMAFQHGRLLKEEIHAGALPQVARILESNVRNGFPDIPFVTNLIIQYFYKNYTDAIIDYSISQADGVLEQALAEGYGLSESTGIALDDVMHGAVGPESLQVVLGERAGGKNILAGLGNSCTDVVALGSHTDNGRLLIGRNTDYPLNGYFDRYPTVLYYQPTDGTQKYMAVTSAGLHNAGVVGFNESGIYLGIHTIPTLDVSTKGIPIFMIGQEVLRTARTMDEALDIFKRSRSASGWTYQVVSTKENRVASVEITNKQVAIRETLGDAHVQTNHFLTPEMQSAYYDMNRTVTEDSYARYQRALELVQRGHLDVGGMIQILSDKWDGVNGQVSALGNVISTHFTLTSAVFDPSNHKLYVANGTAPVPNTAYVELPLVSDFDADNFGADFEVYDNSSWHRQFPALSRGEQLFIQAKIQFETFNNPTEANKILSDAIQADPSNPGYIFSKGIMALKAGKTADAIVAFKSIKRMKSQHYRFLGHYYLGRIYADSREDGNAERELKAILAEAGPNEHQLIKATKRSLDDMKKIGPLKLNAARLVIFMPEADMVEY